jgi:lipopolysaccharide biosynthesis glycosyltransferase
MKIFVGYDIREDIAYQVCEYSIKKHNEKAEVIPLKQKELREAGIYTRPIDPLSSTEFTFTRFLVPYLSDYKGWAVFVDCDFVFVDDVKNLFDKADDRYALMVVKHDYTPSEGIKMDGCKQLPYPRKNWSSSILWNCGHKSNRILTTDTINTQTGQYLHRFQWLKDEEIGELKPDWNWLAGWYEEPRDGSPKAIHYTEGGPWFREYRRCPYHKIWKKYLREMLK